MKKIAIALSLFCATATGAMAKKCYTVFYEDASRYDVEKVTESEYESEIIITCKGSGNVICQFSDGTCPPTIKNLSEDYVVQQMNMGVLSGTHTFSDGTIVDWRGTTEKSFQYTITIESED